MVQRVTTGLKANGDLKTFCLIQKKQNVDKRFVNFAVLFTMDRNVLLRVGCYVVHTVVQGATFRLSVLSLSYRERSFG